MTASNSTDSYSIAIAMYARALDIFARRAGEADTHTYIASTQVGDPMDEEIALRAEELAMPGQRVGEEAGTPLLASLPGHLHGAANKGYYRPKPISNEVALPAGELDADWASVYPTLWHEFREDLRRHVQQAQTPEVPERNLHALLQRYTWAMAAPRLESDPAGESLVSLYDYARMSAALAVCLAQQDPTSSDVALLVGGDLSGVQEWLYTFGSRGAARSLRGRSFYLQILTEVIALNLLDRLKLPSANLLYAGGGNFYLLVPTNKADRLEELRREISTNILDMHEGALYVALAGTPVTDAMLRDTGGSASNTIGTAWNAVNEQINRQKAQRFAELDDELMARAIGKPIHGTGKLEDTCAICRRPFVEGETGKPIDGDETGEGYRKCDLCCSFEDAGNALRDADYLVFARVDEQEEGTVTNWQQGLRRFGYDVRLVKDANAPDAKWQDPGDDLVMIYHWKESPDVRHFPGHPGQERTVWAFRPLAQCIPEMKDGQIATFDELKSDGIERWGVLRMDVDRLGEIFQKGIPAANLSRVVGLSGLMRLFFEGYVPGLAEAINERTGEPRVYLMYAGGDDLFVVGGWSELPGLAHKIQQAFGAFACHNPKVTISGGVSIALGKKYPLYQAARDAGAAEHAAKESGRDAFAFLGQPLKWDDYEPVAERVKQLSDWVERRDGLPRSFIMTLRAIDAEWREWKKQEQGKALKEGRTPRYKHSEDTLFLGPWQWHLVYSLTRAAERTRDSDLQRDVREYIVDILEGEIKTIGLIARWTEYLTRETGES